MIVRYLMSIVVMWKLLFLVSTCFLYKLFGQGGNNVLLYSFVLLDTSSYSLVLLRAPYFFCFFHTAPIFRYFLLRRWQGVPRSTEEYRGVPRSTKEYQGVPRSTEEYMGVLRSTRKYLCRLINRDTSMFFAFVRIRPLTVQDRKFNCFHKKNCGHVL